MKKHLSVLYLSVRSTLLPVLITLVLMAAGEALAFWLAMRGGGMPLSEVWTKSRIPLIAAAALLAVCFFHFCVGSGGAQSNTLLRLRVKERTVTLWWWLSAAGSLALLWAAQTIVAVLLCVWYGAATDPGFVNPQTTFLAFYQVSFLHGLLPLDDVAVWIRNALLLAALSLCIARVPSQLRSGQKPAAAGTLAMLVIVMFPAVLGRINSAMVISTVAFFVLFWAFWKLFDTEEVSAA